MALSPSALFLALAGFASAQPPDDPSPDDFGPADTEITTDPGEIPGTDTNPGTATPDDFAESDETEVEEEDTDPGTGPAQNASNALPALPPELAPDVSIEVEPARGIVTGDAVELVVTVVAREGDDVSVPRQELGSFEIVGSRVDESLRNGRARFVFHIELVALEPGDHELAPVRLRVLTADGTLGGVETDAVTIHVGSVLGNEPDAQAKPATQPVEVLQEDLTLAYIGGGLLGLALLALAMFLIARWWLRRERPAPPPAPPRPASEIALAKLGALRRSLEAQAAEGKLVAWVDALSDALREYLGARYGFDGLESTTDEVVTRVRRAKPVGITVEEVAGILSDSDLVKFAKALPEKERCSALLDAAIRIVQVTTRNLAPAAAVTAAAQSKAAEMSAQVAQAKATSPSPLPPPPGASG